MTPPKQPNQIASRLIAFIAVFCLLASLAVIRNGTLFGKDASSFFSYGKSSSASEQLQDTVASISYEAKQEIINTTEIGKDITGYAGPVPLEIYVSNGRIDSIVALSNSETPRFFQ